MEDQDYETLQEELAHYRREKEQIRNVIGQIGGQHGTWQHKLVNILFITAVSVLFTMDLLHQVWGVPIPLPGLFTLELGVLLVSVKIIWMIQTQSKVDHFQFWILNSIEFRLSDLSKRMKRGAGQRAKRQGSRQREVTAEARGAEHRDVLGYSPGHSRGALG